MKNVQKWRANGIPVCYTMDAGPNVHVITTTDYSEEIHQKLASLRGIKQIFKASVGGKARLVDH
jgi:diphosphomevalonate decarboxylase